MDSVSGTTGFLLQEREALRAEVAHLKRMLTSREKDREWERTFDAVPDLIAILDDQHRIVRVNKAMADRLGRSKDACVGQTCYGCIHGTAGPMGTCPHSRLLHDGGQHSAEFYEERLGGYFAVTTSPLFDDQGQVCGCVHVARDISERKQAEDEQRLLMGEIEKSHAEMLSILNCLRTGVLMLDAEQRVTFFNESCLPILPRDQNQILGRRWDEICPFAEQDISRLHAAMDQQCDKRSNVSVHFGTARAQQYWMEVEVQDDPRDARRRILYLYDMTAVHDLRELLGEQGSFQGMVGSSEVMKRVYEQTRQLARLDSTVLLEGETGSGKELVAQAIHFTGHRKNQPFVALNCAGLTDSLLASQLFGHRRGAFTGAVDDQQGVFETATGGTLFLDEIGDIPQNVQTSLLRVLQEKEIIRLGESTPRQVDVRIIAATHRDLNDEVQAGRFRMDLLYRIRVARISLPALRERRVDIPALVESFLRKFRSATSKPVRQVSSEAMRLLLSYNWPGNVRELQSCIEFAAIGCRNSVIQFADLPPELLQDSERSEQITDDDQDPLDDRGRVLAALERTGGNRSAAAKLLGIGRTTLYRRMAAMQIQP